MVVRIGGISSASSRRTRGVIPSGPAAIVDFGFASSLSIPGTEMVISAIDM